MLILDNTAHQYVRFAPFWPAGLDVLLVVKAPQGELNKIVMVTNAADALSLYGKPDSEHQGLWCLQHGFSHGNLNHQYVMRTDELPLTALRKLADDPTYQHASRLKRAFAETRF